MGPESMVYAMSDQIGIRQNNPGNLELGQNWKGLAEKLPGDRFCRFVSPLFGIRAMALLISNYSKRHGINTIRGMIERYAPGHENNVDAYVSSVSKRSGLPPDRPIDLSAAPTLAKIIPAMIHHENGLQPYPQDLIVEAIKMAGAT